MRAISIDPSEELRRDRMDQSGGVDPFALQCTGKGSLKRTDLQLTVGGFRFGGVSISPEFSIDCIYIAWQIA